MSTRLLTTMLLAALVSVLPSHSHAPQSAIAGSPPAAPSSPAPRDSGAASLTATITGPAQVAPGDLCVLTLNTDADAQAVWFLGNSDKTFLPVDNGRRVVFSSGQAGQFRFLVAVFKAGQQPASAIHTVTVGQGPLPPGPGPDPGPSPPGPGPNPPDPPQPAPIPEPGFRVLIVYETGEVGKMPLGQQAILFGKQSRDYLTEKCVAESDGTKAFRIYDKDIDVSSDVPVWKSAMSRKRESIPWVIISNGTTGYEGPLPATVDEFIALCGKYEVK